MPDRFIIRPLEGGCELRSDAGCARFAQCDGKGTARPARPAAGGAIRNADVTGLAQPTDQNTLSRRQLFALNHVRKLGVTVKRGSDALLLTGNRAWRQRLED